MKRFYNMSQDEKRGEVLRRATKALSTVRDMSRKDQLRFFALVVLLDGDPSLAKELLEVAS